ncbi:hypothetical protein [Legionella maioricensis]|uniref:Uncharacterized protein n=1 Tax=Legionella maioricensis TaxID=2896528 RepID=A0A9X2D086_9GAMM|nr:hypothetical protein [Legionella maioricensis]MCL9683472.1 hypothetical protein [Legionella maioricensis]MCL9686771.1 hypothetical protein [Legionella maioricensis]
MKHIFKNTLKQFSGLLHIDELVYDVQEATLRLRLVNNKTQDYQIYYSFYYPQLNAILSFLEGNTLDEKEAEQLREYNTPFEIQYFTDLWTSTSKSRPDTSMQHDLNQLPLFSRFAAALGRPLDSNTELCLVDKEIINTIKSKISKPIYQEQSPSGQMMNVKALIDKYAENTSKTPYKNFSEQRVSEARDLALERSFLVSPVAKAVGKNLLRKFVCKTPEREEFPSLKEVTLFKLRNMKKTGELLPEHEELLPEDCKIR